MTISTSDVARVCHEANRAYCKTLGDDSQLAWKDAPEWQRESAIIGVAFLAGNPDAGPEALHENWCVGKRAEGWRHGDKKDPDAKVHPCLVPWDELPPEQRRKDVLFQAICRVLTEILR